MHACVIVFRLSCAAPPRFRARVLTALRAASSAAVSNILGDGEPAGGMHRMSSAPSMAAGNPAINDVRNVLSVPLIATAAMEHKMRFNTAPRPIRPSASHLRA